MVLCVVLYLLSIHAMSVVAVGYAILPKVIECTSLFIHSITLNINISPSVNKVFFSNEISLGNIPLGKTFVIKVLGSLRYAFKGF